MPYCNAGEKVTVQVTSPIKENIVFDKAPVSVIVGTTTVGEHQDYTHSMDAPIDQIFEQSITSVALNDSHNDWIFSWEYPPSNPIVHRTCPIPSIQGNKLHLDFDPGAYSDNIGTCTYKVFFGGFALTATDSQGQSVTRNYSQQPVFTVACGDNCPEGQCKCHSDSYPGYCCLDCDVMAANIRSITNALRSKNG